MNNNEKKKNAPNAENKTGIWKQKEQLRTDRKKNEIGNHTNRYLGRQAEKNGKEKEKGQDYKPGRLTKEAEAYLENYTPVERDFKDKYGMVDVARDEQAVNIVLAKEAKKSDKTGGVILERSFTYFADEYDFFLDGEINEDNPDADLLAIFPTSIADDRFSHIDAIAFAKNEYTDGKQLPMCFDVTYNKEKIPSKMTWKHVFGKKRNAPDNVSEYGTVERTVDENGEEDIDLRRLPFSQKMGLKEPGFAAAKFFRDPMELDGAEPVHESGRIKIMPRFVVGYSLDIAKKIIPGRPKWPSDLPPLEKMTPGEKSLNSIKIRSFEKSEREYEKAIKQARCCVAIECMRQARDIKTYLDNLSEEQLRYKHPAELANAKEQIAQAEKYFTAVYDNIMKKVEADRAAIEKAKQEGVAPKSDYSYSGYAEAFDAAMEDEVCKDIVANSGNIFGANNTAR